MRDQIQRERYTLLEARERERVNKYSRRELLWEVKWCFVLWIKPTAEAHTHVLLKNIYIHIHHHHHHRQGISEINVCGCVISLKDARRGTRGLALVLQ